MSDLARDLASGGAAVEPGPGGTTVQLVRSPGAAPAATVLLDRLAAEHPVLAALPARDRLLAAAWLASYRSARTRRAYAGDRAAWLDWLREIDVDVLDARRVHVDLWVRQLLDAGAAASSTAPALGPDQLLPPPRRARPDRRQPGRPGPPPQG